MLLKEETITIQNQLATYCRDGKLTVIKGAKKDRLHNYRRLVYNVVSGSLESAYPITFSVLSNEEWESLVSDFFIHHNAQSNQIWQMPYELFLYAKSNDYHLKLNRPYLLDLILFEWMEIQLFCMPNGEVLPIKSTEWNENDQLCMNPDYEIIELAYPVHKVAIDQLPTDPGNYFIFIFRDLENGKVHFLDISPFYTLLIEFLFSSDMSLKQVIDEASKQLNMSTTKDMKANVFNFIQTLQTKGAVLGSI